MRRAVRLSLWALTAIVVLPLALAVLVVVIANTDTGRRTIERIVAQASGGRVVLAGLAGHFPDRVRVARVEMRDRDGTWGVATDLALDWSPSRLLRGEAHMVRLELARLELERLPVADEEPSPPPQRAASMRLPLRVAIDLLHVAKVELAPPIAGVATALNVRGRAHVVSLSQFDFALKVDRLDSPGSYQVEGNADASRLTARVDLAEPAGGLLARLAGLPDLGALSITASIDGLRNAEQVRLAVAAGPARATAEGTINLEHRVLDLQVAADAPAMRPSAELAWQRATLQGHVKGSHTMPNADVRLRLRGVRVGGGELRNLEADLTGSKGAMALRAIVEGLRIPGAHPDLFAAAPVQLRANARLDDPARPVDFALRHPLLAAEGHATTGGALGGTADVTIPALAPFGAAAGVDLEGRATIAIRVTTKDEVTAAHVDGVIGVTGGMAPLPLLIGRDAKLAIAATSRGDTITLQRAQFDGRTVRLSANGTRRGETFDLRWNAALSDLAALAPALQGALSANGRVRGTLRELAAETHARGEVGTREFAPETIEADVTASGPPSALSGAIRARGRLLGAPLAVVADLQHERDGTMRIAIDRADWKSAHADGQISLSGADRAPRGRIALHMTRLEDLQALVGQPVQGSIAANVELVAHGEASDALVQLEARGVGVPDAAVERMTLSGRIGALPSRPTAALQLVASGIAAHGITGNARIGLNGPQEALTLNLSSRVKQADGTEANLSGAALVNAMARTARVQQFALEYRGETARLLQPALFTFADGVAVDRLRVGVQQAVLDVAGRLSPTLDVRASLREVTPALLKRYAPGVDAVGTLSMDAKLTGSPTLPHGNVRVDVAGVRMRSGPARTLPAANLRATADLDGRVAQVRARLDAGPRVRLAVDGTAPLAMTGRMDLRATGMLDLALANPILEADGRRVQGRAAVDVAVTGLYTEPRAHGTVTITEADVQDSALGAHLRGIAASLRLDGDAMRIARFTGRAGRGEITASGDVGVLQPDMPVDITITARDARPIASDLLTADLDMDLRLRGAARTRIDAAGRVLVKHADINIPNRLPANVAVLDVRRPGETPVPASAAPALEIGLDVAVDAPRAVFIRGRGLDAEMGGTLHLGRTAAAPEIRGGFELRRGTFDLAGATLKFTRGKVAFSGEGLQRKIDPTLDFLAETASSNVTARLGVTGFASAPKIALSSTPELPQDEVLARLLFGVSVKELSPLQLVQIASAAASLSGFGGGGPSLLTKAQKQLGLDRLTVSGGDAKSGPSVEAGRYVSDRVYVGARQSSSGTTQARVQVDLTRHLKLQTSLGSGGGTQQGATPDNDPGTSLGILYQLEY